MGKRARSTKLALAFWSLAFLKKDRDRDIDRDRQIQRNETRAVEKSRKINKNLM